MAGKWMEMGVAGSSLFSHTQIGSRPVGETFPLSKTHQNSIWPGSVEVLLMLHLGESWGIHRFFIDVP